MDKEERKWFKDTAIDLISCDICKSEIMWAGLVENETMGLEYTLNCQSLTPIFVCFKCKKTNPKNR